LAENKNQHIVPICYLSNFIDNHTLRKNINHTPGVWINNSTMNIPWYEKAVVNKKEFTESYFYNLKTDLDPKKKPVIEALLSTVERQYNSAILKLNNGNPFSTDDMLGIVVFIIFQLFRTKRKINGLQKTWNSIASTMDLFEGSERNKGEVEELAKKMLLRLVHFKTCEPIYENGVILFNLTEIPFLTSDNPVVHKFVNREDISNILNHNQILHYPNSHEETPFFFMPLTPCLAYVSHQGLSNRKQKDYKSVDRQEIINLNNMTIGNPDEKIYSSMKDPIQNCELLAIDINKKPQKIIAVIFTANQRLTFELKEYSKSMQSVTLILPEFGDISILKIKQKIISVEVYDPNIQTPIGSATGMRGCFVKIIDIENNTIIIEQNFLLRKPST
jgi:hypothetical protein